MRKEKQIRSERMYKVIDICKDVLGILSICLNLVRYMSPWKMLRENLRTVNRERELFRGDKRTYALTNVDNGRIPEGKNKCYSEQYIATQQISGMPYLCQHVNSLFWLIYAFMNHRLHVFLINMFGAGISVYYMSLFYQITEQKVNYLLRIVFGEAIFIAALFLLHHNIGQYSEIDIHVLCAYWGLATSVTTIINFGIPLSTLRTVLSTKNSDSIPLMLSVTNLCGSITWTLYGVLSFDRFIVVPNCIGAMLSILNLTVKYLYRTPVQYYEKHEREKVVILFQENE